MHDALKGSTEPEVLEPVRLREARPEDLHGVIRLLEDAGLPVTGIPESLEGFIVAERGSRVVGAAGLEVHDGDGVLRSVVVAPDGRGQGLGGRLTERVLDAAELAGLRAVYLLTTTAEEYFPRHGFRRIDRADASPAVRRSVEFAEACPASAVAMAVEPRARVRDNEGGT